MSYRANVSLAKSIRGVIIPITLAIVLLLPVTRISAAGTTEVTVSTPGETIGQGEQFQVDIYVVPDSDIAGMQFELSFDPSLVTVDNIVEGDLLGQNGASTYFSSGIIDNSSGIITAVYGAITSPGQTVSTAGVFATVTFTASLSGGACPMLLSDVIVGDPNGNSVPVNIVQGSVEINWPPVLDSIGNKTVREGDTLTFTISGSDPDGDSLTYSASNLPTGASFDPITLTFSWIPDYEQSGIYSGVHFEVFDGTLITSEDITITVNNAAQCDINGDGSVNILDIIMINNYWIETGPNGWIQEDINEDGIVNVLDIILIGQNWT